MGTCLKEAVLLFSLASFSYRDQRLKTRICSLRSKFFPLRVDPICESGLLSRETNRDSQKLFPFVKMAEKHGGVQYTLNMRTEVSEQTVYM